MTRARWAALAALAFLLYFGIQGGEYATTDLFALRRQEASERAQVQRLRLAVPRVLAAARLRQRAALALVVRRRLTRKAADAAVAVLRERAASRTSSTA